MRGDKPIREAVARVARISSEQVFVEKHGDTLLVNFQSSMMLSVEAREECRRVAQELAPKGLRVSII